MAERRPQRRSIKRVVDWLNQYGLSVYGACIDPETGREIPGCRDYEFEDIMKVTKLIDQGRTWEDRDDC